MSTATYRGVEYDTANYHMKQLEMIKQKIEKAQARYNAERVMAEKRWCEPMGSSDPYS